MNEQVRRKLRNALYDILTGSVDQQNEGTVIQNMGLNLSNAVRKDGVNIIALQSANIHRITVNVTEALKILDQVETVEQLPEPIEVEPVIDHDNIHRIVETNLFEGIKLDQFLEWVAGVYVAEAMRQYGTKAEVQRRLGVNYQRLKKILEGGNSKERIAT